MTERKPLVLVNGVYQEIQAGDTVATSVLPSTGGVLDCGNATSTYTGAVKIDLGGAT